MRQIPTQIQVPYDAFLVEKVITRESHVIIESGYAAILGEKENSMTQPPSFKPAGVLLQDRPQGSTRLEP